MTWQPSVVVAATDGSERSIAAAKVAIDLARSNGAVLHVVTAVRPPEGWWGIEGAPPPPRAVSDAILDAQEEVLDATISQLDVTGVKVETALQVGDPSGVIVSYCEEIGADVLVIGRRGAGLIERFVMGSVADRLAHYAPCPVLIVP